MSMLRCKPAETLIAFINIQVKDEAPEPIESKQVIGADLGRTDICVTSEGYKASGKQITQIRNHHALLRAVLQHKAVKGTRSSRRRCRQLLQRLSGREHRFQKHVNHVVSKTLVQAALQTNAVIALEDLNVSGMVKNRKLSRAISQAGWREFRTMCEAKSCKLGREFRVISRWEPTSQICSGSNFHEFGII